MTEIRFTVEGKPLTWRRTASFEGRKLTPKAQRAYQRRVQWAALAAGARGNWDTDRRFALEIDVYAKRRDFDIDNIAKQIADAGNGVIWCDDRRIDALHVRRYVDAHERVEVTVRVMEVA